MAKIKNTVLSFICNQYLVIFFTITLSIKLFCISTYVLKLTWSGQYWNSIIFSIFSLAFLLSPFYLIKKCKNKALTIVAFLISTLLVIDIIYFSYFSSLPSIGIVTAIGQTKDVLPAIWKLLEWWYLLYFADIIFVVFFGKQIQTTFRKIINKNNIKDSNWKTSAIIIIILFSSCWLSLPLGCNKFKEVFEKDYDIVSTAQYYGVIGTHTVDIARFIQQGITIPSEDQIKEITDWIKKYKPQQPNSELNGIAKGKNVIIIQVESLGGFIINQKVDNKDITPNLNKFANSSYYFPNQRFLYGAGHTSDTDFTANLSYFPLDEAAIFVRYGRDDFTGLPKLMTKSGYSAYVYHGFNRNFWNRDSALKSIGYQKFYAADNYPKGTKINMGLNDGDFLANTADYIKDQPKPSFSYVITLSSHVPFATNKEIEEFGIDKSKYPNQVGGYIENINYTDRMIGKFFEKLKSYGIYDDSLIVIYGDHTPVLPSFKAGTIDYDSSSNQEKEVPLFIKLPKQKIGETIPNKGVHLDIMPTIIDLLGLKTNQLMFGKSLFDEDSDNFNDCPNQISTFSKLGDCEKSLRIEKSISSKIIQYNLFDKLPK